MKTAFSKSTWFKLLGSLLLPQALGVIAAVFTVSAIPFWYQSLHKPVFTPPNWIFGPVWSVLYLMMGVASFLICQTDTGRAAFRFYLVHLAVNFLWSLLFFGLHSPFWAFVDIIVLWGMITALVILFGRHNRWAGFLLIPYWIWVSFAAVLNYFIWIMNRA